MLKRIAIAAAATAALLSTAVANAGSIRPSLGSSKVHLQLSLHALDRGKDLLGLPVPVDIPMGYGGGPVEWTGSSNYAIYWEPPGSVVSSSYHALTQRYFQDIGGSSFYGLMSQYYGSNQQPIANVSGLSGVFIDTRAYPESPLQDADIQAEVVHAMAANGWTGGIGHNFFVFTPKGVNSCQNGSCSFTTYCAYHGHFSSGSADVLYANMPYAGTDLSGCGTPTAPNGDADADAEISIISHEHFEIVTDPDLNAWSDLIGQEIGDKCRVEYGTQDARGASVYLNGHPYIAQQEYSNKARPVLGACSFS